jgi:molybdate transport system substrate-binding protein
MRPRLVLLIAALAFPLAAAAQQLTVSAAASLTDAFKQIGKRFEADHPGVTVRFSFAASGMLIQQISQGAPVDVFASADADTMRRGVEQGLIAAASRRDFAANTLVLIVPVREAPPVDKLADLAGPAVKRIAVGKSATVPVGRYTREALDTAGLWAVLSPKLVQADKVRIVQTVEGHGPVRYPAAAVADSRQKALAGEFVAFLVTPQAQAILARFGFAAP